MKLIDVLDLVAKGKSPKIFKLYALEKEPFYYELDDNGLYYEINTGEELTTTISLINCLNCKVEYLD